jgi:hypothetical protein
VADYFAILRKVELWPTVVLFRTSSVSKIAGRFLRAKADLKHDCVAGSRCPLLKSLDTLLESVCEIRSGIDGFCLRCVRAGEYLDNGHLGFHRG